MKTAVIFTIGSRDIQLKEVINELPESETLRQTEQVVILSNPRKQGKFLINNFEKYKSVIEYPIIKPAIEYILGGTEKIDKIFLFVTNQKEAANKYKNRDTLYLGKLLQKIIKETYPKQVNNIIQIEISGNLTYYDEMYDTITEKFQEKIRINGNDYKVYLLAQGGIDAINTAIMLKSIELFPNLTQLHKPEDKNSVEILSFPSKFKENLNKNSIKHSVRNFNYSVIIENFPTINKEVTLLCSYAHYRLSLDYREAFNVCEQMAEINSKYKNFAVNILQRDVTVNANIENKQKDLYLSAKIKLKQKFYADFLIKIFTLSENILKPAIIGKGFDITYDEKNNHNTWKKSFEEINKAENEQLAEYLKASKLKPGGIRYDTPNKYAFYGIIEYFYHKNKNEEEKKLLELCTSIFVLADLRNTVAHKLENVSREKIESELTSKTAITLDEFIDQLDKFFGLKNKEDYGIYDKINEKILSLL